MSPVMHGCDDCARTSIAAGCYKHSAPQAARQSYGARTPHRCPVCNGTQTVPTDFYTKVGVTSGTGNEVCRACNGTGVLWS